MCGCSIPFDKLSMEGLCQMPLRWSRRRCLAAESPNGSKRPLLITLLKRTLSRFQPPAKPAEKKPAVPKRPKITLAQGHRRLRLAQRHLCSLHSKGLPHGRSRLRVTQLGALPRRCLCLQKLLRMCSPVSARKGCECRRCPRIRLAHLIPCQSSSRERH